MPSTAEYEAEVKRISEVAKQWISAHPDKHVMIAWKLPKNVSVIGVFGDAIKMGIVVVNDDGLELLQAMGCDQGNKNEPSINMVRVALDIAFEQ